ncbi:MAG: hypothetical protein JXR05_15655 [Flavobacteriaceae bacterium]
MKRIFVLSLIAVASLSISSCSTSTIEEVIITESVTYNGAVRTIISNNCLPCHGGTTPSAGLNLETYAGVRGATENGNLINRINSASNPMPVSGQMPPALIATIEQWATDGYLEN